jgi:hypothetical protein
VNLAKLNQLLQAADTHVKKAYVAPGHFDGMLNEGRKDFVERVNMLQQALAAQQSLLKALVEELSATHAAE